jgi:SAM-dependent methyltransferase
MITRRDREWGEFYDLTRDDPPSALLVEALRHVKRRGHAIDIGAGALRDTRYLIGQGFHVTAVDRNPLLAEEARAVGSGKFRYVVSSFRNFNFEPGKYDLASAMYALPYNPPRSFNLVFRRIRAALAPGGVLCGQFFGVRDAWNGDPTVTFHTKWQARRLLSALEVIVFDEEEADDVTADGAPKYWHVFHFIARRS